MFNSLKHPQIPQEEFETSADSLLYTYFFLFDFFHPPLFCLRWGNKKTKKNQRGIKKLSFHMKMIAKKLQISGAIRKLPTFGGISVLQP